MNQDSIIYRSLKLVAIKYWSDGIHNIVQSEYLRPGHDGSNPMPRVQLATKGNNKLIKSRLSIKQDSTRRVWCSADSNRRDGWQGCSRFTWKVGNMNA